MRPMTIATDVRQVLRDHGYRMTTPRWLVWSTLRAAQGHLTAEEVADRIASADPTVNRSSIYRSLTLFEELDLARSSNLGIDDSARWELAHPDDEFHLVCDSCGSVSHHESEIVEQIRTHLREHHEFTADGVDVVVTGRCPTCASVPPE